MPIQYVGGTSQVGTGATMTLTVGSGLTGGIGSAAAENDIIIVIWGFGGTTDATMSVSSPTGYSVISDLYSNDTWDSNVGFAYKVQTATPDTTVVVNASNDAAYGSGATARVYRGVDTATPLDVTTTTVSAAAQSASRTDCPAITPVTRGATIIAGGIGMQTSAGGAAFTIPANMNTGITVKQDGSTSDCGCWSSHVENQMDVSFNPDAVTGGSTNASSSYAGVTIALRPLQLPIGIVVAPPGQPHKWKFR